MLIWVDCTAAAHPLVLSPLIEGLVERGHQVRVTARAYGQTEGILERLAIPYSLFGAHAGAGGVGKAVALASRSASLARWAGRVRPAVGLAHGSVDLAVVGAIRRIPTVQMQDYEFAGSQRKIAWRLARTVIVPDSIPLDRLAAAGAVESKLLRYPGLKEDYYLAGFEPDRAVLADLGLGAHRIGPDRSADDRVLIVVRPPPESSAYHADNPLYGGLIERLAAEPRAVAVVIARTDRQRSEIVERADPRLIAPAEAIDAQSLIAYADLVISAGGTMNREAVALGIPVYTIFSGRMGAVDEQLIADGKLLTVTDPGAIRFEKRPSGPAAHPGRDAASLIDAVLAAAR